MVSIAQERVGKGPTPPYLPSTLLVLSQSFSRVCCLSLFPMGKSANKKNTKKRKLDDKAHYCCMSASQRAAQYPGVMEHVVIQCGAYIVKYPCNTLIPTLPTHI